MAIVGEGTAFETIQKIKNNYEYDFDSIIFGECRSAILLIEAVDSGVHWGEPGDFEIETVTKEQLFPGDTKGILVGFCNQEVWYIERTVPMEILKHFMTVESSKEHDREKELAPYGRKITTARGFVDSYKSEWAFFMKIVQQLPITPPSKKQTAALDHVRRVVTARLALLNNARNIANENDIKI